MKKRKRVYYDYEARGVCERNWKRQHLQQPSPRGIKKVMRDMADVFPGVQRRIIRVTEIIEVVR